MHSCVFQYLVRGTCRLVCVHEATFGGAQDLSATRGDTRSTAGIRRCVRHLLSGERLFTALIYFEFGLIILLSLLQEMYSAKITRCRHFFHGVCLRKWLYVQDRCPLCHEIMMYTDKPEDSAPEPADAAAAAAAQAEQPIRIYPRDVSSSYSM